MSIPFFSTASQRRRAIVGLIVIIAASVSVWWFVLRPDNASAPAASSAADTVESSEHTADQTKLRLIASGDELPHETVTLRAKTADGYDYKPFFGELGFVFDKADVSFCNQEALSSGEAFGISGYPAFNAPTEFARDLSAVGCNVISLANNHLNDKGQQAINKTVELWESLKPLAVAGANRSAAEQAAVRYFEVKGVRFAFVAYTEISNNTNLTSYGVNMLSESLVQTQLSEARSQADIVLVSAHWGTEDSTAINSTQQQWAQFFAAQGADIVLGTGPHVIQTVQKLPRQGGGETIVWYSLGNLLSTQLDITGLIGGFAVMDFTITDDGSASLQNIGFLPTYMHYEWTPEQKAAEDLLQRTNLKLYPLDQAAAPLTTSQHATTVEVQTTRISDILNMHTPVSILTSTTY